MLTSLALIFLLGLFLGTIFQKLKLPALLGMIITGIILGPYALNLLDGNILQISSDLRRLALVIILTRAGLSLDIGDLKKVGRPAILMCFVPACFEIIGVIVIGTLFMHLGWLEACVMGTVLAATSPAVVVPKMLRISEEGYGTKKSIPQMILAGASVDGIVVIILFAAFSTLLSGADFSIGGIIGIPVSIVTGILVGVLTGFCLVFFFRKFHIRDSVKILIILSISFLLLKLEAMIGTEIPFSGLLAILSMSMAIYEKYPVLAGRLSVKYNKLWVAAEILLFVLVGAQLDIGYALTAGISAIFIVIFAQLFRMAGVFTSLVATNLNGKERLFCVLSYIPKATVQAAIGGIPLAMGLAGGNQILMVAVVAILLTAPVGAICIEQTYKKLLTKE